MGAGRNKTEKGRLRANVAQHFLWLCSVEGTGTLAKEQDGTWR